MAAEQSRASDPNAFLARLDSSTTRYRKKQIVFSQGDVADAIYYVQKGKLKVTVVSGRGKEAVISVLGPDEFFGEGCLAGQGRRAATVEAMTDCVLARIDKAAIARLLDLQSPFSQIFMTHILRRTVRVEADLIDQLFNSSEMRLARLLLILANHGKDGAPERLIAHLNQETLAEMIGTTRSRVSFFMNKFRKLGLIDYTHSGAIEVRNSLLNLVLLDQPHVEAD
jgi:CRP/FNR family cyclic AMP-dependent transcriptional regulator